MSSAFDYRTVELDLSKLFQSIDTARRNAWEAMTAAQLNQNDLAHGKLHELKQSLARANDELLDLMRKVNSLKQLS